MNEGIVRIPRIVRTLSPLLGAGLLLTAACDMPVEELNTEDLIARSSSIVTAVLDIAASNTETWAVTDDGQVKGWGQAFCDANGCLEPAQIAPIALPGPAKAVRTNGKRVAALMADGSVQGWHTSGPDALEPYALPVLEPAAVELTLGLDFYCTRMVDGLLGCQGWPGETEPGWLADVALNAPASTITAGAEHICAAHGSVHVTCWGSLSSASTRTFAEPVKQLVGGESHTCALLESGMVECWGDNSCGQLGVDSPDGGAVQLGEPVRSIAAGAMHTCAIGDETDALYCWGSDSVHQLGHGSNIGEIRRVDLSEQPAAVIYSGPTASTNFVQMQSAGLRGFGEDDTGQRGYGELATPTQPIVGDLPDILIFTIPDED